MCWYDVKVLDELKGGSKFLERMADETMIRPDKAL